MATLTVPACVPPVQEDVEQLHKAFSGWGTNENLIISILAHRNAVQRKAIRHAYVETHGKDLLEVLDKELSSDFERAILVWTLETGERDAYLANEATKIWTSSNQVLMEIACTRSPKELVLAREAYHARYKKSLEEDVSYHTKGDCRKLLVALVTAYRYPGDEANLTLAKKEAQLVHDKIKDKAFTDDDIIRIFSTRSKAQINATLNQYKNLFENDVEKDLEADCENDFVALLTSTIQCLAYPEKYFEKVLRDSVNKRGTEEWDLTRVITTRAEVDLKIIQDEYHRRNSVPLDQAIAKDTSGDYEKMLLALMGHDDA